MDTQTNTQNTNMQNVTEIWQVMRGEKVLGKYDSEKSGWKSIGAKNSYVKQELANCGFKVVKL